MFLRQSDNFYKIYKKNHLVIIVWQVLVGAHILKKCVACVRAYVQACVRACVQNIEWMTTTTIFFYLFGPRVCRPVVKVHVKLVCRHALRQRNVHTPVTICLHI